MIDQIKKAWNEFLKKNEASVWEALGAEFPETFLSCPAANEENVAGETPDGSFYWSMFEDGDNAVIQFGSTQQELLDKNISICSASGTFEKVSETEVGAEVEIPRARLVNKNYPQWWTELENIAIE